MNRAEKWRLVAAVVITGVLITGSAQALPGKNTVDSSDIINGQVKTQDLGLNTVTGTRIKNGTVTGNDVKESSLDLGGAGCKLGLVHSFARIKGAAGMPSTYTTSATWVDVTHNCSGGTIEVRRSGAGIYCIRVNGDPAVLAQTTAMWDGSGIFNQTAVSQAKGQGVTCGAGAYQVHSFDPDGSFADTWVSFLTF